MDNPTKAKVHSAIDRARPGSPVIFIAFDEKGESTDTSFLYGEPDELRRLLYYALGQALFAAHPPVQAQPQSQITVPTNVDPPRN
jgi:hypothetical protein